MSVVNDVLKNLNERHAKELSVHSMPYMYEETSSPQYGLWLILAVVLCASVLMGAKLWLDSNQQYLALSLPADLFFAPIEEVPSPNDLSEKANTLATNQQSVGDSTSEIKERKSNTDVIAKKTEQTEVIEGAVAAVKKGDTNKASSLIHKTPRSVQDELKLHMMVKDEPQSVLPYIQKNFPNFSQHPQLLALAAQGEQRSGAHKKAITLYQQLIRLQPNDARWRAGLGISLVASGSRDGAARMYQLALRMDNLPSPLATFCRDRLQSLTR